MINDDSRPRVQIDSPPEKDKAIEDPIKPNSYYNDIPIPKVFEPSYITQPIPTAKHRYPTRATVAAAANTTQMEQQ